MAGIHPSQHNDDEKDVAPESVVNLASYEQRLALVNEKLLALAQKSDNASKVKTQTAAGHLARIGATVLEKTRTEVNLAERARNTRPILHSKTRKLIENFLALKKEHGSEREKAFYTQQNFSVETFIDRLLTQRPLAFYTAADACLLRDGSYHPYAIRRFEAIGTDNEAAGFSLDDYLSYDEMGISALLGVSSRDTHFINKGDRNNYGFPRDPGSFQETGGYVGLVGARLEREGAMEYQQMVVSRRQNTPEKGYGTQALPSSPKTQLNHLFAKFYGIEQLPTYNDVVAIVESEKDKPKARYVQLELGWGKDTYFDTVIYKERLRLVIEPFLLEANACAAEKGKKVYVYVVGLGMGAWCLGGQQNAFAKQAQEQLMLDVYSEIIQDSPEKFASISDIDFGYFGPFTQDPAEAGSGLTLPSTGDSSITARFSIHNPADKLTGEHANKELVAMYAWDGNSKPGNELWLGSPSGSGDPAAACCSDITLLQDPEINTALKGENVIWYGDAAPFKVAVATPEAEEKEEQVKAAAQFHIGAEAEPLKKGQEQVGEPGAPHASAQAEGGHEQKEGAKDPDAAAKQARATLLAAIKEEANKREQVRLAALQAQQEAEAAKKKVEPKKEEHKDAAPLSPPPTFVPTPPKPPLPSGLLILSPLLGLGAAAAVYFYPGALASFSLLGLAGPVLPAVLIGLAAAALVGVALGIYSRGPLHSYFAKYPVLSAMAASFVLAEGASFLLAGLFPPVQGLVLFGNSALPFGLLALGLVLVVGALAWVVSESGKKGAGIKGVDPLLPRSGGQQRTPANDPKKGQGPTPVLKKGEWPERIHLEQMPGSNKTK